MIYVSGWLGTRMTLMLGDGDAPATAVGEDEHCMEVASAYLASAYSFFTIRMWVYATQAHEWLWTWDCSGSHTGHSHW